MLNWSLQPKSLCLDNEPDFVHSMFVKNFDACYNTLRTGIDHHYPKNKLIERLYSIEGIDDADYDNDYLGSLLGIKNEAKKIDDLILGFILHGSMATLDFVKGWSDVDTMMILKNESFKNYENIQRIREVSHKIHQLQFDIDYHQHHGVHFVSETDLMMYPDLYLPNYLFAESRSLLSDVRLNMLIRDCYPEQVERFLSIHRLFKDAVSTGVLKHHAKNGIYLKANFENADATMYQLKYYLSVVMLLPSYFLNLLGINCSKKESFSIAKNILNTKHWEIIEKASHIRRNWDGDMKNNDIVRPSIIELLGEQYFQLGYNLSSVMAEYLYDKKVIPGRL